MGERTTPQDFLATLAWLVERRQLVIEFRNHRIGEYTTHSFVANATSWAAGGGPIRIIYDAEASDATRKAGGDE